MDPKEKVRCAFHKSIIKQNRKFIQEKIDPVMVLDHMGDKVSEIDRQRVIQQSRNWGNITGSRELMDVLLRSCPGTFVKFVEGLCIGAGDSGKMLATALFEQVPQQFKSSFSRVFPHEAETGGSAFAHGSKGIHDNQGPQNEDRLLEEFPHGFREILSTTLKQDDNWRKMLKNMAPDDRQRIKGCDDPAEELLSLFLEHDWTAGTFLHHSEENLSAETYHILCTVLGVNYTMDPPESATSSGGHDEFDAMPEEVTTLVKQQTYYSSQTCRELNSNPINEESPQMLKTKRATPEMPRLKVASECCGPTSAATEDALVSCSGKFIYKIDPDGKFTKRLYKDWLDAIETVLNDIIEANNDSAVTSTSGVLEIWRFDGDSDNIQELDGESDNNETDSDDVDRASGAAATVVTNIAAKVAAEIASDDEEEENMKEIINTVVKKSVNVVRSSKQVAKVFTSLKDSFSKIIDDL